jgi:hypothetical protein
MAGWEVRVDGSVLTVALGGGTIVGMLEVSALSRHVLRCIRLGHSKIVVDLSHVDGLAPGSMGELTKLWFSAKEQGADLVFDLQDGKWPTDHPQHIKPRLDSLG